MGQDIQDILRITPENLADQQLEALKNHVKNRLSQIIALVDREAFSEIGGFTQSSPAGDGYGSDNEYISFVNDWDIAEVFDRMGALKNSKKKGRK